MRISDVLQRRAVIIQIMRRRVAARRKMDVIQLTRTTSSAHFPRSMKNLSARIVVDLYVSLSLPHFSSLYFLRTLLMVIVQFFFYYKIHIFTFCG